MEVNEAQGSATSTETTSVETSGATTAPQETATSVEASVSPAGGATTETASGQQTSIPAYTPNFGYRAMREEKQFPEWMRPFVKTKSEEDNFRSLLCKADALDPIKTERDQYRDNLQRLQTAAERRPGDFLQATGMRQALSAAAKSDPLAFLELTGMSMQDLIGMTSKALKIQDMSPEEKSALEQYRRQTHEYQTTQQSYQDLQAQHQQMRMEVHNMQLDSALADPQVSAFVRAYDERAGEGAFRNRVEAMGNVLFHQTNQYMSPRDVVKMTFEQESKIFSPIVTHTASQAPVTRPATIPNVGGNGRMSAVKSAPKSIADLRKRAEEISMEG